MSSEPKRRWRTVLALFAGGATLALVWTVAAVSEPYVIRAYARSDERAELSLAHRTWIHSDLWLVALACGVAGCFIAGFTARRISRNWLAPGVLLVILALYIFLAQLPTSDSLSRNLLWSVAVPVSFLLGAVLGNGDKEEDQ
jgi:hypothetical protein